MLRGKIGDPAPPTMAIFPRMTRKTWPVPICLAQNRSCSGLATVAKVQDTQLSSTAAHQVQGLDGYNMVMTTAGWFTIPAPLRASVEEVSYEGTGFPSL